MNLFLQELLGIVARSETAKIRRELARRDARKNKPRRKPIPFVAIGNNELGGPIGATTACPGCNEAHAVEESVPAGLSFVLCLKTKHRYLVGVDGKKWGRT